MQTLTLLTVNEVLHEYIYINLQELDSAFEIYNISIYIKKVGKHILNPESFLKYVKYLKVNGSSGN